MYMYIYISIRSSCLELALASIHKDAVLFIQLHEGLLSECMTFSQNMYKTIYTYTCGSLTRRPESETILCLRCQVTLKALLLGMNANFEWRKTSTRTFRTICDSQSPICIFVYICIYIYYIHCTIPIATQINKHSTVPQL